MEKVYLAVVEGTPGRESWICYAKIGPEPKRHGVMRLDERQGKDAQTAFRVLQTLNQRSLIEARPHTGRTHQIRLHLAEARHPVVGDELYGSSRKPNEPLGLRAVGLAYHDPFTRKPVRIRAPIDEFVRQHGFEVPDQTW